MNWTEMTYDQQRAALGLWQPTVGFHWQRMTRRIYDAVAPAIRAFGASIPAVRDNPYDYGLAGGRDA